MAIDKAVDSTQLNSDLTSVANAIRTKGGTSASLAFPAGFVSAIGDIPSGGGEPTYGLLTTINITEEVATISYNLPELALSDSRVWVEFDNLTFTEDWLYMAVLDSRQVSDHNGYANKGGSMNGIGVCFFDVARTFGGVSCSSYSGTVFPQRNTTYHCIDFNPSPAYTAFTRLFIKLYDGASRFKSGAIKVYGRVS